MILFLTQKPQLIFWQQLLIFFFVNSTQKEREWENHTKKQTFKINRIMISNLSSFYFTKVMPFLFCVRFIALTFEMVLLCDVQHLHSITPRCKWSSLTAEKRPKRVSWSTLVKFWEIHHVLRLIIVAQISHGGPTMKIVMWLCV